jgi:hypothetical protein
MSAKDLLLGIFIVLTIVFAAVSFVEYDQARPAQTLTTTITTTSPIQTTSSVGTSANPITFNYSSIPSHFTVGGYNVTTNQGTDYIVQTGNGTSYQYLGFYTLFSITLNNRTQYVPFFWNTPYTASTSHPPYNATCYVQKGEASQSVTGCPYSATAFGGDVSIAWTEQNSTMYVTFTFT